ncbi:6-phosphogluconate dehydrogenase [Xylariomycetidae sp. FL0641]|nr:6-phosphogluconate dehydrogenase [Xylariomycetidae sp. FL0641]
MPDVGFTKVGMLGVGSMGAMMSLLMAERGYEVFFYDPSDANMDQLEQQVKDINLQSKVHRTGSYDEVCQSLGSPKAFMFSTPHGTAADKCVQALKPHLQAGDLIVDCGNEHWENTERRQRDLDGSGVHYVGCGVSGGYQSARAGPSMSPGGSPEALAAALPFLRTLAARDARGRPCTAPVGPRGAGHYVKMVHNGIEQGMMSVLAEAWALLTRGLGLGHDAVGEIFERWNAEGPLRDCFLVGIGAEIERAVDPRRGGERVVDTVRDKVVQDVTEEEGTGTWTCEEAVARHVPAASIVAAHLFRCASADLARRLANQRAAGAGDQFQQPKPLAVEDQSAFVDTLRQATYFGFLCCFAQGLDLIRRKDRDEAWGLDYRHVLQLWRGGCIIRAEHIAETLDAAYARPGHDPDAVLGNPEVAAELAANYPAAKAVVLRAAEADLCVPATSQSLEYFKYQTSANLPTQFMEAQLDYFGQHMYDRQDDPVGGPEKGRHHFEWKPAKGSSDQ